jgi:16S rRNA (uracil1498-N3)-methyltransferase
MGAEGRVRAPRRPDTLFWVDAARVASDSLTLDRDESHHLLRVHRAEVGAPFEATDGAGTLYRCRLVGSSDAGAQGEILERRADDGELPASIRLLVGLPDTRAVETVVAHAVPLGAAAIVFVACERAPRGPLSPERLERLGRLAIAGVKQSRRSRLPSIETAGSLAEVVEGLGRAPLGSRFAAHPGGGRMASNAGIAAQGVVNAAVGPPGGFADRELEILRAADFGNPQHDLQQPGRKRDSGGRGPAELVDQPGDDHGHSGRRAAHLKRRPAKRTGDDTADDSGDQAGDQGRAGRGRDPERQRDADQEHDEGGGQVVFEHSGEAGHASSSGEAGKPGHGEIARGR